MAAAPVPVSVPIVTAEANAEVAEPDHIATQVQKSIEDIKRRILETEDLRRCKAYSEDLICVQKNSLELEQKEKEDIRRELQIANDAIAQRTRLAVESMKRAEIAEKKAEEAVRQAEELRGHLKELISALAMPEPLAATRAA